MTTGALYHHFPTKTALFEAVFVQAHTDMMTASTSAAQGATDSVDELARGFEAFLDGVMAARRAAHPDSRRPRACSGWRDSPSSTSCMPTPRSCMPCAPLRRRARSSRSTTRDHDSTAARGADPRRNAHRKLRRPCRDAACRGQVDACPAVRLHSIGLMADAGCHDAPASPVRPLPADRHADVAVDVGGRGSGQQRCGGRVPDVVHDGAPTRRGKAAGRPARQR